MNKTNTLSIVQAGAPVPPEHPHQKPQHLALSELEVAQLVGCSLSRLRQDRHHARGLPYVKWGRSVRYLWEDLKKYLEDRRITHHVQ